MAVVLLVLGCERVKDKESLAELPVASKGDTLVLAQDTAQPAPLIADRVETDRGAAGEAERMGEREAAAETSSSGAGVAPVSSAETKSVKPVNRVAVKKRYTKPSPKDVQLALRRDARLTGSMGLEGVKQYWLKRQHYYRKAVGEVKYVSGHTKININQEETKIETARGKVKIEGNDIKVKPD
ncbi:hypothetical protein [Rufibacter quisquiliarum]|uniref:Uncharacterized protein n=1 Tax=Rufibacter quisquiliarum TaxID=1549639 RepID=A0A839GK41_9BACT|nr:hypothetical protein [Rufibacter quisquiliarum]MBA9075347.1 hypothetical protein [Rufibacter quisquiliarum]